MTRRWATQNATEMSMCKCQAIFGIRLNYIQLTMTRVMNKIKALATKHTLISRKMNSSFGESRFVIKFWNVWIPNSVCVFFLSLSLLSGVLKITITIIQPLYRLSSSATISWPTPCQPQSLTHTLTVFPRLPFPTVSSHRANRTWFFFSLAFTILTVQINRKYAQKPAAPRENT